MRVLIRDILAVLPEGPRVCSICLDAGRILSINEVPPEFQADKILDGTGRLLIPGLVNAHTHAYMTVFRNYADDLMFNDWLFGKILPLEDRLTEEDCYWGTLLGILEMLRTGTTAFADMYIASDFSARAVSESGIRAVLSRGLVGGADDPAGGERRLREALAEVAAWQGHENITFMLAPHAPYTCDEGYQREVAAAARQNGLAINIHLAESIAEIETIRGRYGCTPIELVDRTGLLNDRTVAAHCVHLTDRDIVLLAQRGTSVVTNPVSNLKLGNGAAPVLKLMKAGVNVALGTDGAASNNTLNLFRDLSFVTLLHKGLNSDAQAVSAYDGFRFATRNGARALGFEQGHGELLPGAKADLTILNLDHPNLQPLHDPVSALSYSCSGSEVETVLVNGTILYDKGNYPTIDQERVVHEVQALCERIGMK